MFWKKKTRTNIFRQGDVLLRPIQLLPPGLKRKDRVLAYGEITGHKHQFLETEQVLVFEDEKKNQFVSVLADQAVLTHEEHKPQTLPKGDYEVILQREFDPLADSQNREAIRKVMD